MRPRAGNGAGFTLIELMVVLVLIGIMTALIIPEMTGTYEEAHLRAAGRKLVNVFQLAHSRAITLSQVHRVRLDPKHGRYAIETTAPAGAGERGNGLVPVRDIPGGEGELDARITVGIRKPGGTGAEGPGPEAALDSGEESRNPARDEAIAFYPDGTADAGEVLLRDRQGFRLALRINPTTARVEIIDLGRE